MIISNATTKALLYFIVSVLSGACAALALSIFKNFQFNGLEFNLFMSVLVSPFLILCRKSRFTVINLALLLVIGYAAGIAAYLLTILSSGNLASSIEIIRNYDIESLFLLLAVFSLSPLQALLQGTISFLIFRVLVGGKKQMMPE